MSNNKNNVAILLVVVAIAGLAYAQYYHGQTGQWPWEPIETPTPPPATPTPTPTTPTPTPTSPYPTPTQTPPTAPISLSKVEFEYNGKVSTQLTVPSGSYVDAHIHLQSNAVTTTYIKIEWVKNIPYWPDDVVYDTWKKVDLKTGDNDVVFGDLTDLKGPGNYFVRVYKWSGYWERIDPWTDPISNPGRPSVTFQ